VLINVFRQFRVRFRECIALLCQRTDLRLQRKQLFLGLEKRQTHTTTTQTNSLQTNFDVGSAGIRCYIVALLRKRIEPLLQRHDRFVGLHIISGHSHNRLQNQTKNNKTNNKKTSRIKTNTQTNHATNKRIARLADFGALYVGARLQRHEPRVEIDHRRVVSLIYYIINRCIVVNSQ
jgi:hypothetical protein